MKLGGGDGEGGGGLVIAKAGSGSAFFGTAVGSFIDNRPRDDEGQVGLGTVFSGLHDFFFVCGSAKGDLPKQAGVCRVDAQGAVIQQLGLEGFAEV